jgi:hypothetical protein
MTDKQLLELALKALEGMDILFSPLSRDCTQHNAVDRARKAITAIKQALADSALDRMAENARELGLDYEPAQEPVVTKTEKGIVLHTGWDDLPAGTKLYAAAQPTTEESSAVATPVQEPVGFMNAGHVHEMQQGRLPYGYVYPKGGNGASVAVYTAPLTQPAQQKPVAWVREHELPLVPGDAFSWVETFVHKTPLYTTPPSAQPAPVQEPIEDFKKRLAAAIDAMPFGDTAASFAVFIRNFK